MKQKYLCSAALCVLTLAPAAAQERLDSAVVSTTRAGLHTPVAYSTLTADDLRTADPSASLPMALSLQPSVVTYNEGGTGLGNSAMTVRGSKGSQVNVTLNGITLNDAESQEVFWVNIPSLTSLVSSVQLQRGLGTSAAGAGAFGASINMSTAFVSPRPYASADFSAGSYGTALATFTAGTSRSASGFYANAAFSFGHTDGYIRNARVDARSAFVTLGWLKGNRSLRLTWLMGDQRSGITWDGISLEQYALDRTYNGAGEHVDDEGNVRYYDNQIDRYGQHHLQLNYTRGFGEHLTWSTTANWTRGDGYDEYYKTARKLANYGLPQGGRSDMTYRKRMDNDCLVLKSDLTWQDGAWQVVGGAYAARYLGRHHGELLWVKALPATFDYAAYNAADTWYRNASAKDDGSAFVRAEYSPVPWLTAYADLQYRRVGLTMDGTDDDYHEKGDRIAYDAVWNFFNPRTGLTFIVNSYNKAYLFVALGHREPGRSDIKENIKGTGAPVRPERMVDVEAGWAYVGPRVSVSANLYLMEYRDMLLETGRLSSSGYAIKENIPSGYRRGLELAAAWSPSASDWFSLGGNATFSRNRIADYISYVPVYGGADNETRAYAYGATDMMMSPSLVGMVRAAVSPFRPFVRNSLASTTLSFNMKYVGRQYIDNTSRAEMEIPAYAVADLVLSHTFDFGREGSLTLSGYVHNLFDRLYYAYGWRWEAYYADSDTYDYGIGVYPQAPRHFTLKASYRF